jgi:hypothetical protein
MYSFEYLVPAVREVVLVDVVLGKVCAKVVDVCLKKLDSVPELLAEPTTRDTDDRQHGVDEGL